MSKQSPIVHTLFLPLFHPKHTAFYAKMFTLFENIVWSSLLLLLRALQQREGVFFASTNVTRCPLQFQSFLLTTLLFPGALHASYEKRRCLKKRRFRNKKEPVFQNCSTTQLDALTGVALAYTTLIEVAECRSTIVAKLCSNI